MLYFIISTFISLITSCRVKLSVHKTNTLFKIAPSPIIQWAKEAGVIKSYILLAYIYMVKKNSFLSLMSSPS